MKQFNLFDLMKLALILMFIECESLFRLTLAARPPVEINKCCRNGERLDRNGQCTIGDGSLQWWPPIFLIKKRDYFKPHGEAPPFIRSHEYTRPNCSYPDLILSDVAIFSNGSLFLSERNSFIDSIDYCVDKDIALVCLPNANGAHSLIAPIKLTKIRKCCGHNSIYLTNTDTCIVKSDEHTQISDTLFTNQSSSNIDLVYGFPACSPAANHKYVIADQFREQHLNTLNGTYALDSNRMLKMDEFCIDHTVQAANVVTETVFACADLVAVKEAPEIRNEEVCSFVLFFVCHLYRD